MEKALKERGITLEEKTRVFYLSGDTEPFRPLLTNMEGKELRGGKWSFPIKDKTATLTLIIESHEESTGAGQAPDITVAAKIREELEKEVDLDNVDPEPIYNVVYSYFGELAPSYEDYLELLEEEVGEMGGTIMKDKEILLTEPEFEAAQEERIIIESEEVTAILKRIIEESDLTVITMRQVKNQLKEELEGRGSLPSKKWIKEEIKRITLEKVQAQEKGKEKVLEEEEEEGIDIEEKEWTFVVLGDTEPYHDQFLEIGGIKEGDGNWRFTNDEWVKFLRIFTEDKGIDIEEQEWTFIVSGDTEPYHDQFLEIGGIKEDGNWRFTNDEWVKFLRIFTDEPKDGVERVALDPEDMSTTEILSVCEANDLAVDPTDREECLKGAEAAKPFIDPREIRLQIRKELEKELDLNKADPKLVYDVVVAYFGRDIAPDYEDYLPLYQEELELEDITLTTLAEKPPTLEGLVLPMEEKIVQETTRKKPRKRTKKLLEIDAKTSRLFRDIHQGTLRDIISFVVDGNVEFIKAALIKDISLATTSALLAQNKEQEQILNIPEPEGKMALGLVPTIQDGEDAKSFALRKHITLQIDNSSTLDLSPDTAVLLGFILTNKVQYGVRYDPQVEAAVDYVLTRM